MSRYDGLTDHLRSRTEPVVELTFLEIERLVVGGLPASARKHATWWPNTTGAQPHSGAWLDARRHAKPDFIKGRVRFELTAPPAREAAPALATDRHVDQVEAASLEIDWETAGLIKLSRGKMTFPPVPAEPGLYRFNLLTPLRPPGHYIGESVNLARRMNQLGRPGTNQKTNQRVNAAIKATLVAAGSVEISISVRARLDRQALDLGSAAARRLAENASLVILARAGVAVENI
jgi:hypothetical protein